MKRLFAVVFFTLLIINLVQPSPLTADELRFKNGDRISGKILNMNEKQVVIKTTYAGEITANWSEIVNAKTDQKIAIILKNGIEYLGNIIETGKGMIMLNANGKKKSSPVSIEDIEMIKRSEEEGIKIKTRANAGMSYTRGNTNKDNSYFDGEFSARTTNNRYSAGGELNRTKSKGIRTENNAIGFLKYDRFLSKRLFVYGNAQYEKDKFKDLNLRSVYGLGSGYQFLETPLENLYFEAGVNYVSEDYITAADEKYASGRWAVNYDKFLYNKVFQLFHFHEGFGSFEDADDMFIKSKTGVRIPIFTNLNASLQYNFDWDNTPSPGRKKTDRALMFTLGYFFAN